MNILQRIPEPELMDDAVQARAYAEADFSGPHDAFVAHFRSRYPEFRAGAVIDLGCGPADVTIRFARALPQATVVGVDGAEAMLALAREAVAAAGLAGRVGLRRARLPDALAGLGRFDAVISNSLLHHLDDPQVLWRTVGAVGRAGAPVLVMDLMRPADEAAHARLVATYAAGAPAVLERDFANSLRAAYRPGEVAAQLRAAGLDGLRVEVVSDRHLLAWGRL